MNVVWLASFPRSGVTFLRHVIERLYGVPTWTLYKHELNASGVFDRERRWPRDADGSLPVYFVKSHIPEAAAGSQSVIHLVRDGRDAIVSLAHYARDILKVRQPFVTIVDGLVRGNTTLGHWGAHTMAFAGRHEHTAHITFEHLIHSPRMAVAEAIEALGLDLQPKPDCRLESFQVLHAQRPKFFRSGTTGQWEGILTDSQTRYFNDTHGYAQHWFEELDSEQRERREAAKATGASRALA